MAVAQPLRIDVEITGTCQTCKYWDPNELKEWQAPETLKEWDREGWGVCLLSVSNNGDLDKSSVFVAVDSEQYQAQLNTRPSFGCNQHEPKETESAKD